MILGKDTITDFIDTVSLARELYPFWKNHKLETCALKFGVVNNQHHRAENDTVVLMHIGKRLITEFVSDGLNPINFTTKKNLHYKN
jgi:DNA polymerase III alpha subunit (gram-positive type)